MSSNNHIDRLVDEVVAITQSERNKMNGSYWEPQPPWARDLWRGIPRKLESGRVPYTVDPAKYLWSQIVGFDFHGYYTDPDVHLSGNLKMDLHKFNVFRDNTYFEGETSIWFGWVFETSMFGAKVVLREEEEPIIGEPRVLEDYKDLTLLEPINFYTSGLMSRVHQFYEQIQERVRGRFKVRFPTWCRGLFSIAIHLRGMDNLLIDLKDNPKFVHDLMRLIVESEKYWLEERSKFTGEPIQKGKFYNDEIGIPLISPGIYRDFILPYEIEIANFRGGVTYFHSCGNTTDFLPLIKQLPGLKLMHVGPWTDKRKAVEVMAPEVALEFCLHPVDDALYASETQMREQLRSIKEIANGKARFSIRSDAEHLMRTVEEDHEKILNWCGVARDILGHEI